MTSSPEVNKYAVNKFRNQFGEHGTYRLISPEEMKKGEIPEEGLFSDTDDYINLGEVVRDFPHYHEIVLKSSDEFQLAIEKIHGKVKSIPLFLKKANTGKLLILTAKIGEVTIEKGDVLIYAGQEVTFDNISDDNTSSTSPEEISAGKQEEG
jgi:hypothetical protein